ncbi:MAG: protein of unknown function transrane [Firmicutes bacterium]|nr:protein of unknown function transrane [Bacillota bacterium]
MKFKANLLLLLTAAIWGFAFVALRAGVDYIGPFTFIAIRFALGSLFLLPFIFFYNNKFRNKNEARKSWQVGLLAGLILFIAVSFQQVGLKYTTAGKAAFITCLYIVLVPIMGVFLKKYITISTWFGSILGTFFWTAHILLIDHFARRIEAFKLAFFQFMTCALLSLGSALVQETVTIRALLHAGIPILYGGIFSVAIGHTLQIIGQKYTFPSHTATILSMQTVFAAFGGYLLLGESLGLQEILGCIFMIVGMLLPQIPALAQKRYAKSSSFSSED